MDTIDGKMPVGKLIENYADYYTEHVPQKELKQELIYLVSAMDARKKIDFLNVIKDIPLSEH